MKYTNKSTISAHLGFLLECLKLLAEVLTMFSSNFNISNLMVFSFGTRRTPKTQVAYIYLYVGGVIK